MIEYFLLVLSLPCTSGQGSRLVVPGRAGAQQSTESHVALQYVSAEKRTLFLLDCRLLITFANGLDPNRARHNN